MRMKQQLGHHFIYQLERLYDCRHNRYDEDGFYIKDDTFDYESKEYLCEFFTRRHTLFDEYLRYNDQSRFDLLCIEDQRDFIESMDIFYQEMSCKIQQVELMEMNIRTSHSYREL